MGAAAFARLWAPRVARFAIPLQSSERRWMPPFFVLVANLACGRVSANDGGAMPSERKAGRLEAACCKSSEPKSRQRQDTTQAMS
jgi:hypothetical protein